MYALVMLTTIVLIGVGLAPVTSAHATATSWNLPTDAYNLQVGPNQAPRALNCRLDGSLYAYSQTGVSQFSFGTTPTEGVGIGCGNMYSWDPMRITDSISASGNSAVAVDTDADGYADTVRLYSPSGAVLWNHSPLDDCGNPARIKTTPVISNGVVSFTYNSCNNWRVYYMTGLDEANHSVVYNTSLGWASDSISLAWYQGGCDIQ